MESLSGGDHTDDDGDYSDDDGEYYSDGGGDYGGNEHDVVSLLPSILPSLSADADPSAAAVALTSLCQALSFTQYPEDLEAIRFDDVIPGLVSLAGNPAGGPHVTLMSARALSFFLDLVPRKTARALARHGGVEVLVSRLTQIEYMDLAEQCLIALEKLSKARPEACLKAGVVMAVLSFVDFFEISYQRIAVSTVANACKQIPNNYLLSFMVAVPTLINLLHYEDQKIVESAATCLIRVVDTFSRSSELLDELCKHGIVEKSLLLISPDASTRLSEETRTGLLGLLGRLAACSVVAVKTLFEMKISSILGGFLRSCAHSPCTHRSNCNGKSCDQVEFVLNLFNQLIPPVTRDDEDIQLCLQKENIIVDQPDFLLQFAMDIIPISVQMVNSGANTYVCYGCVSLVENITYLVTPAMLLELLKKVNMPRFLAGLLSRKDQHLLISTIQIVKILVKKLPKEVLDSFIKEGVIHAIYAFAELEDHFQSLNSHIGFREDRAAACDVSSCLCYAFRSNAYPLSSGTKTCRIEKHTLPTLARHVKSILSTSFVDSKMGLSKTLQNLKTSCTALESNVDNSLGDWSRKEEQLFHVLDEVIKDLKGREIMSTFEFIESGIARAFAFYLSNGKYLRGSLDNYILPDNCSRVLKRFQTFSSVLLSELPATFLVQYLQNALSALDQFPVVLSSAYKPVLRHTNVPPKCSTYQPCLQVRFIKEEEERDLCNYGNDITVHFSSSFDAIEEALLPKVYSKKNKRRTLAKGFLRQRNGSSHKVNTCGRQQELIEELESRHISASGSNQDDSRPRLIFLLGGKQCDRSMSLYQAVLQDKIKADPDFVVSTTFWDEVHIVTFRMRKEIDLSNHQMSLGTSQLSLSWGKVGLSWQKASFFCSMLFAELPCALEKSNSSYDMLFMLKILEGLNRFSFQVMSYGRSNEFAGGIINNFDELKVVLPTIPQSEFINSKLTDKLQQQMQDSLAVSTATLPSWCGHLMEACPFLFSFEARWKYFCLTTSALPFRFPIQRTDGRLLSAAIPRKRLTVHRNDILGSAEKLMSWQGCKKVSLEVQYSGEVGTGLGPTLEFYTLVSHELQKVGLGMWRGDNQRSSDKKLLLKNGSVHDYDVVIAPSGLFPRPWSKATSSGHIKFSRVKSKFFLLGQLTARAIQDGRRLDLPFSKAFYKLMLDKELDIYDIQSFDPELGMNLVEFQALANRKRFLDSGEHSREESDLSFRKARIEDLCLSFTLPGYPDYVFASRRKSNMVNINNLEGFVSLVVDATVRSGIFRQLEAFKSGFDKVFPLETLQIFTEEELERIVCGEQEDPWNVNEVLDHIKFDHGYISSNLHARNFVEIIQEFKYEQRRSFLQFVTGSPRLPPGGLAALKPKMTVVRKHCGADVDLELPSVMTCANYLKLPPYSSKEKMRDRLLYAVSEGQGSFHLS